MTKYIAGVILILNFGTGAVLAEEPAVIDYTIEITGIRADQQGQLIVGLYAGERDWLKKDKACATQIREVVSDTVLIHFNGLTDGQEYALFAYHDRNENKTLDFHRFPIPRPREGIAVSNNAVRWGKPLYEKARFRVNSHETKQTVTMHY